ncbi:putative bifunctional diguanylate cyclase/phosphodiesterase [Spongisporangium articulatum]|uniref:Bifunctional diguanylate cyclase/phosphodiesterase n=1 Tax=Spongisporangium articulatum TaxID=3362603 RepID=A0ABW8API8_9ACTN
MAHDGESAIGLPVRPPPTPRARALAALAASAVPVALVVVVDPPATPAAALLVTAAALQLLGLALTAGARGLRRFPGQGWEAWCTLLGVAAFASCTLGFAVRPRGDLTAADVVPVVASAAVAGVAVSAIVLSGPRELSLGTPALARAGLPWIAGGLVLVAAADQVALADRGRPAAASGGWLPGTLLAAGYLLLLGTVAVRARRTPADRRASLELPPAEATGRRRTLALGLVAVVVVVVAIVDDGSAPRASTLAVRAGGLLAAAFLLLSLVRVDRTRRPGGGEDVSPRTDDLTGLANRRALSEALAGERPSAPAGVTVPETDATGWSGWAGWSDEIALLLVDLDHFKDVNEALGHAAGDRLLAAVGARLRGTLRPTQLLARLGGDEFAVVLPAAGPEQAERVAADLRASLETPFEIDGNRLHVQASIGMATCDPSHGEPTDLLRQADVAMYQAKGTDSGVAFYDPSRDEGLTGDRLRRTDELRDALQRGDLEVHLQPQVDLRTGAIVGAEALARWRHPQDGVLLPQSFLPLAEHTGLMRPVTAQLLDRALAACATWWNAGHKVTVSVNLGADDLRDPEVGDRITRLLAGHALPPAALRVEITEQALLTDPAAVAVVLGRWRDAGVAVAIDDFGTGYSSLSYLRELPVDEVKLDRAFIADARRETTSSIVRHTAALAHDLGAVVVAEGIEDEATARRVAELGCDVGQGIHFGAAMTAGQFLTRLETS